MIETVDTATAVRYAIKQRARTVLPMINQTIRGATAKFVTPSYIQHNPQLFRLVPPPPYLSRSFQFSGRHEGTPARASWSQDHCGSGRLNVWAHLNFPDRFTDDRTTGNPLRR